MESCSAPNAVIGGSPSRLLRSHTASAAAAPAMAARAGTVRGDQSTPAAAVIRAMSSLTVRGSPFDTTKARLPTPGRASSAASSEVAALSTQVVSTSARPEPINGMRPLRARSTMRPINWVSPGPMTRWGRTATTGIVGSEAARTARSAIALDTE